MSLQFTIAEKDTASKARAGVLRTDHGTIHTPIFMPVGTAATVKGLFHRDAVSYTHLTLPTILG